MKNRVGKNATTNAGYIANSVSGQRLKGAVITAIIYWENGETISIARCTMDHLPQMYYCIDLSCYSGRTMIRPECY